jgi:DNA-binding response OmpR family regulator
MMQEIHTVLCIDDDLDTCEILEVSLGMSGYKVAVAHSVEEGLCKARKEHFSLYSIDSHLPDGSGVELCKQIRKFDLSTPIIFNSANAFAEEIKKALDAGAQAYLIKPTDPFELTKTVESLITNEDR